MRLHSLLSELFPINRSLTGEGVRDTLRILKREVPELQIHEVPLPLKAFDWELEHEWRLRSARLYWEGQKLVIDALNNPLHVVGYSEPFNAWLGWEELKSHLIVGPEEHPDAIPYATSYYERRWGFCVSWNQFQNMPPGSYYVNMDTELFQGRFTYADLVIPGETKNEILLGTYCCHPNLAVNETSGMVVLSELVNWWKSGNRRHTLRALIAPETLGPLVYMSQTVMVLRDPETGDTVRVPFYAAVLPHLRAGFVLTCMGARGSFHVQEGREPNYASEIAKCVLRPPNSEDSLFGEWSWRHRCSDERQWTSPGIDLPVCTVMKSRPGLDEYHEYHTSLDTPDICTEEQLQASLDVMKRILTAVERDQHYCVTTHGEPQLGRRGLYDTLSVRGSSASGKALLDVWSMCDGRSSLEIAKAAMKPLSDVQDTLDVLESEGLVEVVE